ncbi:MAG: FAD-dependent oxidoreductase [Burkholderiales bacterium]|mgnify:FL=1|jgi:NADPH-dependent glutamate synthase beta subunit-like oxidoreductase/ferredoxin|tara:strand:+ start:468 stop:2240 length:1773 start_codon:yes stop_codon:yes gene_type:complete
MSAPTITALTKPEGISSHARDIAWVETNIPCQVACPAGTDIPGYIEAINNGKLDEAYAINFRDNVFPGVLGRVCSRPCESACRHGRPSLGESVAICALKRSSADLGGSLTIRPNIKSSSGYRVAVVGAGVAGLAAARDLALEGHKVIVYDKHRRPGGMMVQGIPSFRLPRDVVDYEINQVLSLGIELKCGVSIGDDQSLDVLVDSHDAVVLAAGTLSGNRLDVQGANLPGVEHGLEFLMMVNEQGRQRIGSNVVVIGGGYTAMDCARTAIRLGAETAVYYRRGSQDMVVLPGEVQELLNETGSMNYFKTPSQFRGVQSIQQVSLANTSIHTERGKPIIRIDTGSSIDIDVDSVILATGQTADTDWISGRVREAILNEQGDVSVVQGALTPDPKVFVAGDFATGATTLIDAIAHGRKTASLVTRFLTGQDISSRKVQIEKKRYGVDFEGGRFFRTQEMNVIPITPVPTLDLSDRQGSREVELGYNHGTSQEAGKRCYLCHYKFEIDNRLCVLCDECIKVKPTEGCIVPVSDLEVDDEGGVVKYKHLQKGESDSLYYNQLWIDQDKCIRCGQCEAVCPVGAISIQKVSFIKV